MVVRNFDQALEADWLHALWHKALSPQWSMGASELKQRLSTSKIALTAELDGTPVGFCAASYQASGGAVLQAILVDPSRWRMGVGTALLQALERTLEEHEVRSLSLGYEDSNEYFWPGVPESQHAAWNFFSKHGWRPQEQNFDLLIDLAAYGTPPWVKDRLHMSGATLHLADSTSAASINQFERRNFPKWAGFYGNALEQRKYDNVLCAKAIDGAVVGTVLLNSNERLAWSKSLGARCGSFAVLGVSKNMEGKGIGAALAARAAEIVKERGCTACYIDWTGLVSWYAKLGATVWSEYRSATKQLRYKPDEQYPTLNGVTLPSTELLLA